MAERPILFSGPMVRAILEGRKTQTRRVVKNPPAAQFCGLKPSLGYPASEGSTWAGFGNPSDPMYVRCPYGQPGDRLWVRETWMPGYDHEADHARGPHVSVLYRADNAEAFLPAPSYDLAAQWEREFSEDGDEAPPWHPSIHMPRWACRLVLEITDVRVERLQAISEADAAAEGAESNTEPCDHVRRSCDEVGCLGPTHRAGFADLWASINGQASWDANPWVWVVEFRPLSAAPTPQKGVDGAD